MPKARTEVPLRCLGAAFSLLLLIINILGGVILFVFGPFFLLRPCQSIYFGTFSIIVVLSLIVSMIAFAWPDGHFLIYTLANRYWVFIVMIAARGAWLASDVWTVQDTLVGQCQAARQIGQSSEAFVTELVVDSFVTCSDGVRIFVIVTLTALSADLFLHIAISICARGLQNILHEAELPLELDQDRANVDTERRSGPYIKPTASVTGRDGAVQGYKFPSHPLRPLHESYASNSFQPISPYPQLYDSNPRRSVNSTCHNVYTFPNQRTPYQTIQSTETRSSQNRGHIGGFAEQEIKLEGQMCIGRKKMVPLSTCLETDVDQYTYEALEGSQHGGLPRLCRRQRIMEPPARHQRVLADPMYRKNSVPHNAYNSDLENPISPIFVTPIPVRDAPFVIPQARFVESPTQMDCPPTPASTTQTGTQAIPPRDTLAGNSISKKNQDTDDGTLDSLLEKNCNRGVQLLVANPDVVAKTEANKTQDNVAESVDDTIPEGFSETKERPEQDAIRTTKEQLVTKNAVTSTPISTKVTTNPAEEISLNNRPERFTQMQQSTLSKKPSLVIEDINRQSCTEHPYRNAPDSNSRFSNPSFRRRPYPYKKRRGPHIETKRLSRPMMHITGDLGGHPYGTRQVTSRSDAGFVHPS